MVGKIVVGNVHGAEPSLETRALDILSRECLACHNEEKSKGGLTMVTHESLMEGGDYGAVLTPGEAEDSVLVSVLAADSEEALDTHMPPDGQLSDLEIATIRAWALAGAKWDGRSELTPPEYAYPEAPLEAPIGEVAHGRALAVADSGARMAIGRGHGMSVYRKTEDSWEIEMGLDMGLQEPLSSLWSADDAFLAVGGFRELWIWDASDWAAGPARMSGFQGRITALASYTAAGPKVAVADSIEGVGAWVHWVDLETGTMIESFRAHEDTITDLDFESSGALLASVGADSAIHIWERSIGVKLATLEGHSQQAMAGVFAGPNRFVSGGVDGDVKVWDLGRAERLFSVGKPVAGVTAMAWDASSESVLVAREDRGIDRYSEFAAHSGAQRSRTAKEKRIATLTAPATRIAQVGAVDAFVWVSEDGSVGGAREGKVATLEAAREPVIDERSPSFVRDILPELTAAGCGMGKCHAKPNGQNGFRLSIFAYDPKTDYREIVKDGRSRRVFPSAPDASLLLLKPTLAIPHEGGERLEVGSERYEMIRDWIRGGMVYQHEDEPELERIEAAPDSGRFAEGEAFQVTVTAIYSDGSQRDVTALSAFQSSDESLLEIQETGEGAFIRSGVEAAVIVRYMGTIAKARFLSPASSAPESAEVATLPVHNFIDELAQANFERLGLYPSSRSTDETFFRRAALDAVGRLPTLEQVERFLDPDGPLDRSAWIDEILSHRGYADYWANHWADVFRPNPDRVGIKSVYILDQWLRGAFRENMPYDDFARSILLHEGTNHGSGPAVIYRDRREPEERMTMFGQAFMGVRFECARCHHHPFESWSQEDFYQAAGYFSGLDRKGSGLSPPISAGKEWFYAGDTNGLDHPVTGVSLEPKPPGAQIAKTERRDVREEFVDWLTQPRNPYFSKAIVNRVWSVFFGRGFVEPIDDFRESNPATQGPLLNALSEWFADEGYDLKALMRLIMESNLYQLSSEPSAFNIEDTRNFSRYYRKRLKAETLLDAVCDVTDVPERFDGMPEGTRAMEAWTFKTNSHFMDAFSRPNASTDPPCERDSGSSVVQALHLMNADKLDAKLRADDGYVAKLVDREGGLEDKIVDIYRRVFSRSPKSEELRAALQYCQGEGREAEEALQDILWALINSAEFVFNH